MYEQSAVDRLSLVGIARALGRRFAICRRTLRRHVWPICH
jgi:hypothetical protein